MKETAQREEASRKSAGLYSLDIWCFDKKRDINDESESYEQNNRTHETLAELLANQIDRSDRDELIL